MYLTEELQGLYKGQEVSSEDFERAWNVWNTTPHEHLNESVVCKEPPYRHGKMWLSDRSNFVVVCPGDLLFLDSENEPWGVADPDGGRLRLLGNGRLITKDLLPCEKKR